MCRSRGLLVTLHRTTYREHFIPSILHEFVTSRQFGCGVEEKHENNAIHVHLVLWCNDPFTWVKENIKEQTGCPKVYMVPLHTYFSAIEASAYLCKQKVPQVWAVGPEVLASVKKNIVAECLAFRTRQNTPKGYKAATAQLQRVERKWFPTPKLSEEQLAQQLFGSEPDSSGYSIEGSQPL